MIQLISYTTLVLLGFTSIFLYARSKFIFSIIPAAVLIGGLFLVLGKNFTELDQLIQPWHELPAMLINIVFGSLLIGRQIIGPRKIWRFAGPQVVFGQSLAWGQYVIGSLVTLFILVPIFNFSPFAGALIEISFEGGHGTAAGLSELFTQVGFAEGVDLALGLATVGLVVGLTSGLVLNLIFNKHRVRRFEFARHRSLGKELRSFTKDTRSRYFAKHTILRTFVQILLIGLAVAIGFLLKESLVLTENTLLSGGSFKFFEYVPVFPLAMVGGVLVQLTLKIIGAQQIVHTRTVNFISNIFLELLIIAAIATMSLATINSNLAPFSILAIAGIAWNILAFLLLAPPLMGKTWFRRAIGDYGQSMGMTATGLLLMHVADPKNKTKAVERFGYKQLLFEPIVGGGLFTASSMIIILEFGLPALLYVSSFVLILWLLIGYFSFIRK